MLLIARAGSRVCQGSAFPSRWDPDLVEEGQDLQSTGDVELATDPLQRPAEVQTDLSGLAPRGVEAYADKIAAWGCDDDSYRLPCRPA